MVGGATVPHGGVLGDVLPHVHGLDGLPLPVGRPRPLRVGPRGGPVGDVHAGHADGQVLAVVRVARARAGVAPRREGDTGHVDVDVRVPVRVGRVLRLRAGCGLEVDASHGQVLVCGKAEVGGAVLRGLTPDGAPPVLPGHRSGVPWPAGPPGRGPPALEGLRGQRGQSIQTEGPRRLAPGQPSGAVVESRVGP